MKTNSENVWLQYKLSIRNFISSKIKDTESVNDLMQEIFIKLHINLINLKQPEKIQQWLYAVTRNHINDFYRKQKYFVDIESIQIAGVINENSINQNLTTCMNSLIQKLPKKNKEAITLVEIEHMSQIDFAKKINISYSGAKSRLQRGKNLLKSYFKKCCDIVHDKYGNIISVQPRTTCYCDLNKTT